MTDITQKQGDSSATGAIVLADGTVFLGNGTGAAGTRVGELCFNTAITGYQEILTDPSYAEQIILFTFPHIGNVGANDEDHEEASDPAKNAALGAIFREPITPPSNWRASDSFTGWLEKRGIIGLSGVDTRALTRTIREKGMPKAAICHQPDGDIDIPALIAAAKAWDGLEQADLAAGVDSEAEFETTERLWELSGGFAELDEAAYHVVLVDFGVKKNILRNLAEVGARVTVVNGGRDAGRHSTTQTGRHCLVEWTGRPCCHLQALRRDDPRRAGQRLADPRYLYRAPALGAGAWGNNQENGAGPSRRQPPGQGSNDRKGRNCVNESWLYSGCRHAAPGCGREPQILV